MKTLLYHISQKFARVKNIPAYFVAIKLTETNKAVYLYGRGTTKTAKMGFCMNCGRTLSHPVSVELGIGPECGKHYWDWDEVGGYSKENIARLTKHIKKDIKIDNWIPKSVIKSTKPISETVRPPKSHKMLKAKKKKKQKKRAKQIELKGKRGIKITFPFKRKTVKQVKKISGRKFHKDGKEKYWTAPATLEGIRKLKEYGFSIDPKLIAWYKENRIHAEKLDGNIQIPGLNGELFNFQGRGVQFIEARKGRALIADEMGLGKTIQALAWLQLRIKKRPAVIVVPSSLKLNWQKEANQWMKNPDIEILNGRTPYDITGNIIIINYAILKDWVDKLINIGPKVLIGDEIHYTKNNKAKRTKAFKKIAKKTPHVLGLTGTPIVNRPVEILNAIQMIDSNVVPDRWSFLKRYCGAKHNGFGWDFDGATNTEELHEKLTNTMMIRRKKEDVLDDLPEKTRSFIPLSLTNKKEYNRAENDFIGYVRNKTEKDLKNELKEKLSEDLMGTVQLDENKLNQIKQEKAAKVSAAKALVKIGELKQLAVKGKLDQAIKWIKDYLDSGNKLVVMAVHKFVINRLMDEFDDIAVKVDGSVSGEDRNAAIESFQNNNKVKLFVGNIKAAGVGLTLTAASAMAFLELPWTPGDLSQAEDRIHRIGQKENCTYYYLLAKSTIERKIANMLDKKRKILDAVLDGKEPNQESLLSELMKTYQ